MKYAKKIILYPPARSDPLTDKLNELDKQMTEILSKKGLNVHEKMKLYNDIMAKTLSIENQYKNRFAEDETPQAGVHKNNVPEDLFDVNDETSPMDISTSILHTPKAEKQKKPTTPKSKNQKRPLDVTMPLVDARGKDVEDVFKTKPKRRGRQKKVSGDPPGYNSSNRIKKQQQNQLLKAWEEFERLSKLTGQQWLPIEQFDRGPTTRQQSKKQKRAYEEDLEKDSEENI